MGILTLQGLNLPHGTSSTHGPGAGSMMYDISSSLLSQLCVLVANLATLRLAASFMTPNEVGEFALVGRIWSFLAPILMLGLGVGLPRCLGRASRNSGTGDALLISGWLLGLPVILMSVSAMLLFPQSCARLLFGNAESRWLVLPLALLVAGNQIFQLVYAVLRGRLQIFAANFIRIVQYSVVPVVVLVLFGRSGVRPTLLAIGIGFTSVAGVSALVMLYEPLKRMRVQALSPAIRELAAYSLPRMPGDVACASLYALGPLLAAHFLDLHAAGVLAVSMSLMTALSAAFGPLGVVLLPRFSYALAQKGDAAVAARLPMLMGLSTYGAMLLIVVGALFGNDGLRYIVGPDFVLRMPELLLLVSSAGGNMMFMALRSLIDASYFRPVNSIHSIIALCVLVCTWLLSRIVAPGAPLMSVFVATGCCFLALGLLTLGAVTRRFQLRVGWTEGARWASVQILTLALGLGLRTALQGRGPWLFILGQTVLVVGWAFVMHALRVHWPGELRSYIVKRKGASNADTESETETPPRPVSETTVESTTPQGTSDTGIFAGRT